LLAVSWWNVLTETTRFFTTFFVTLFFFLAMAGLPSTDELRFATELAVTKFAEEVEVL
jgi:hypothetical protein